jgi:hypothetical protein
LSLDDDEPELDEAPGLDIELLLELGVPVDEVEPVEPLAPEVSLLDVPLLDVPLLDPLPVMLLPEPVPELPALALPPEVEPPVALDDGDVELLDDELGDAVLALLGVDAEPAAPLDVS